MCLVPSGASGLKSVTAPGGFKNYTSHPIRGEWIENCPWVSVSWVSWVSPHTGRVD